MLLKDNFQKMVKGLWGRYKSEHMLKNLFYSWYEAEATSVSKEKSKQYELIWNKSMSRWIANGDKTGFSRRWRKGIKSLVEEPECAIISDLQFIKKNCKIAQWQWTGLESFNLEEYRRCIFLLKHIFLVHLLFAKVLSILPSFYFQKK